LRVDELKEKAEKQRGICLQWTISILSSAKKKEKEKTEKKKKGDRQYLLDKRSGLVYKGVVF
jgi:hypothetical protein